VYVEELATLGPHSDILKGAYRTDFWVSQTSNIPNKIGDTTGGMGLVSFIFLRRSMCCTRGLQPATGSMYHRDLQASHSGG
jgi:hypothetical protein